MSIQENKEFKKIQFYLTANYNCGYVPEKKAQSIVASPYQNVNQNEFDNLITIGFRRSGNHVYKPHCHNCEACTPIRLDVYRFKRNRTQERCFKKNNLVVVEEDLDFLEEDFLLYSKYQKIRHNDLSSSLEDQREEYKNFLLTSNFISKKIKFYHNDKLLMVSIVDYLNDGISAVYTFYNRNYLKQSLGTYSILWLIEKCKIENLPYPYLGYWIKENDKMNYKTKFKPFELFEDKQWKIFNE